jgi:capsular exopolysaccharide synthesis family protein
MKDNQDLFAGTIDYQKVFYKLYSYKKYYIVITVALLIVAFLVNRYATVQYKNSTTIDISDNSNNNAFGGGSTDDLFQAFGMFNSEENIDNELEILKSFSLVKKVIVDNDLKVTYFSYKNSPAASLFVNTPFTRKTDLYGMSPIEVQIDPSVPQAVELIFNVKILNENEFTIETDADQVPLYNYIDDQVVSYAQNVHLKQRFRFGDEIKTRNFTFRLQKTKSFNKDFTNNSNLCFILNDINQLTMQYQGALDTETTTERSTLIITSLTGNNRQRITDFLNSLNAAYLGKSMDKKNKTALSTIDYIDSQISDVADSLNYAEAKLRNFRSAEGVMDLNFQGQQVFEQLNNLENDRAAIVVQKKYYEYLNNYLATNTEVSDLMAPSSMNVVDPILTNLLTQLFTLNAERGSLLRNSTAQQNLYLTDINIRIENLKKTISETVKNTLNTLSISLNEINYRVNRASSQISQMPKTELQLRGIERKFELNDAIYTFLLQKRSEAQIARASSLPEYEVVDPAILAMAGQISPKRMLNYAIAIFLGLILPSLVIMLKDLLNNKLTSVEEVENLSSFPIMGTIFHNFHRSKLIVNDHPNSSVTESFRAVRTNFQFFSEGGKRQIILFTSSSSGEGKTFCSINLASVFALNNYRTVLLEFDLRRPKIHQEFGSSNIIGISSFLIDKASIDDIIAPTHIENLDLISAGPAAPNPAELIASERTGELFDKLKEMYDYIIIDSAPAGILAESLLLMKYSDLNIFVARMNKTIKEAFKGTLKSLANNKINTSILINDLNVRRESYRYAYDNKYYTDDRGNGFFARLFKKSKKAS